MAPLEGEGRGDRGGILVIISKEVGLARHSHLYYSNANTGCYISMVNLQLVFFCGENRGLFASLSMCLNLLCTETLIEKKSRHEKDASPVNLIPFILFN